MKELEKFSLNVPKKVEIQEGIDLWYCFKDNTLEKHIKETLPPEQSVQNEILIWCAEKMDFQESIQDDQDLQPYYNNPEFEAWIENETPESKRDFICFINQKYLNQYKKFSKQMLEAVNNFKEENPNLQKDEIEKTILNNEWLEFQSGSDHCEFFYFGDYYSTPKNLYKSRLTLSLDYFQIQ